MIVCPCCSGMSYRDCCEKFIAGVENPATPEQLMRSRYTAYTLSRIDYIEDTMKEAAAFDFDKQSAHAWSKKVKWQGLEVMNATCEGDRGFVEFKAFYLDDGKSCILHEISEFKRIDNKWYYVDHKLPQPNKKDDAQRVGRNDACMCGSGKKYKKCCMLNN